MNARFVIGVISNIIHALVQTQVLIRHTYLKGDPPETLPQPAAKAAKPLSKADQKRADNAAPRSKRRRGGPRTNKVWAWPDAKCREFAADYPNMTTNDLAAKYGFENATRLYAAATVLRYRGFLGKARKPVTKHDLKY